ncbi:recombinase family protein [Cytophagaceae bacterium DM2B3-1]|uniref:Recombinase family protein n=1 Tax=Xanthocytophaga flava TaxID=3048013 RepID=A0ABT7CYT9_9BACT|nr:recombinase family protein [Xanthocytophaga flavus]MDJ1498949.1 recombinase family protein [Xanthocytophaga flavus]
MKKAIAYYRVSSDQQGQSGLGIEAQQQSVRAYVTAYQLDLIEELTEVESGKKNKRPILLQALELCRKKKALLVIAKLDRLGRNVAFISSLMEAKVEFVAVDNPHANKLMLHMLAAFAEHEREQISIRTKDALSAAKRRGVMLGENGRKVLSVKNKKAADEFALQMAPLINEIRQNGHLTVRAIMAELNRRQVPTSRGGLVWHLPTVHALLKRMKV